MAVRPRQFQCYASFPLVAGVHGQGLQPYDLMKTRSWISYYIRDNGRSPAN
jgi:hypothetical protein